MKSKEPATEHGAALPVRDVSDIYHNGYDARAVLARTRSGALIAGALLLVALSRLLWLGKPVLLQDEVYYWQWSRHLAVGYFDHPPLIAWIIRLSTALFGGTEFGVRAGTAALGVGVVALAYLVGTLLGGRLAGWLCLAATATCPLLVLLTSVAVPDAPLLFFWSASVYALLLAVTREQGRYWYAAGLLLGLALLAKYTALLLVPAVLLYMLLTGGAWLRRREPYLAGALAVLVFSPNLWWNLRHGWVSYSFQLAHGACQAAHADPTPLGTAALFLLAQAGIVGPLLAASIVTGTALAVVTGLSRLFQPRRRVAMADGHGVVARRQGLLLLACCTLTVLSFFVLAHGLSYWAAPAYFSGIICAGVLLARVLRAASARRRAWGAAFGTMLLLVGGTETAYGMYMMAGGAPPPLVGKIDPILTEPEFPWPAVGRDVAAVLRRLEPEQRRHAVLVGDNFSTSSEVAYYTPGRPLVYSGSHQYRLWPAPAPVAPSVVLYIGNHSWLGRDANAPLRRGETVPVWVWVGTGSARRGLQITVLPLPSGQAGAAKMQGILASTYFRRWSCR